jgi:transposase
MGYNIAGGGDEDQVFLMPPDPRDWLPEGHLAWAMRRAAGELDLAPFLAAYRADGQGNTAYHPRVMVALVMYCYAKGIRSSRAIEMATWDDVGARVICGGLHPDHATNARFAGRHREPLKGLLVASLAACAREGLVRVDVVAGDGTKVKANASMAANATAEQLDLGIAELEKLLEAEVEAWIEQARAADAAEDALSGGDGPPPGRGQQPGGGKRTAQKLARRRTARARLAAGERARRERAGAERQDKIARLAADAERLQARAAEERARAEARVADYARRAAAKAAAGSRWRPRGKPPSPPDQHHAVRATRQAAGRAAGRLAGAIAAPAVPQAPARPPKANTTDPASRVMPIKKGGWDQQYNLQALAARGQVIVAIGTHDSTGDVAALHPLLAAGAANLAAAGIPDRIGTALFDAGYASEANFTAGCGADLYVAVTRESRQAGKDPAGKDPAAVQSWQQMAAKLDTPEGRGVYKQRKAIIEPVFAQLFARFGRTLNYRGDMVTTEVRLQAAVHNMLKAIRARARRERHAAARPAPAAA